MNKILTATLAALAGFAASASAQVSANFSDLILGFRATSGTGQNTNLEVNLGSVSQFTGLTSGSVMTVTRLSAADLASIYGSNWNTRTDLSWGVIGTAGRLVGGPGGQPVSTLWATNAQATVGTQSNAWTPGSRNAQANASATIETVFFAAPGSLNGKAATANSSSAAAVNATLSGSYTAQDTNQPGTSFGFFNPSIDNSAKIAANGYAVSDLYELQPGATSSTYVGSFGLSSSGQLYFVKSAGYFNMPAVTTQPANQSPTAGGSTTLTAAASGTVTYQWQRNGANVSNGANVAGATTASVNLTNLTSADTGIYTAVVSTSGASSSTNPAILGVTTTSKAIGAGNEVAANIAHPNGNIYDQVLLTGAAASITADAGQVTRISYVDLTDDIVQIEFGGAGTLSVVLDNATGPANAVKYNQPTVTYMRGHAGIVITGANETTNVSVFSVGKINAVNQALFKDGVTYDGMADIAFIAISSTNGKFGGVRTSNANYFATKGITGVYAPGVQFTGPVYVGDINASDAATPVLQIGSTTNDVRITGGDLLQTNAKPVTVSGFTSLQFRDGSTSGGGLLPAQVIKGRLVQNGLDVTSTVALAPGL